MDGKGVAPGSRRIIVAAEMDKPNGFDYSGVQWVDLTTDAGTERIWERQSGVED